MSAPSADARRRVFAIRDADDRLWAGQAAADSAAAWGFDDRAAASIQIVVSELASNVARHGCGGTVSVSMVESPFEGIEIVALDNGPGIADVDACLVDGFSEGHMLCEEVTVHREGLGSGLGAVARLTDCLEITNRPGGGLAVTALRRLPASGEAT